jgi:RNase P subunit RPR2
MIFPTSCKEDVISGKVIRVRVNKEMVVYTLITVILHLNNHRININSVGLCFFVLIRSRGMIFPTSCKEDVISGKVIRVRVNKDKPDNFYLTNVCTTCYEKM